jgi:hypothetical protein
MKRRVFSACGDDDTDGMSEGWDAGLETDD